MLNLTQAVYRVSARLNKNAGDSTVYARIRNHINDACLEKWHGYAWSFRFREYPLVLTPTVTAGTMTATNGSKTFTASGTPFDSTIHVGAWIYFPTETLQAYYRIQTVSSTSVAIIEPAYQGTTAADKTYRLIRSDYTLPSELSDVSQLNITSSNRALRITHQASSGFTAMFPISSGVPVEGMIFNQDSLGTSYTTGTVSGTINTQTLTGVGTAWLTNITPGEDILINGDTNTYTVRSVSTDTSLTLYQKLMATATSATYTATDLYGKVLRLTGSPDQAYVLFLKGLRQYVPMINTADSNELLYRYPHAVIESAIWREAGSSPDDREDGLYMRAERMWLQAQSEDEALFPVSNDRPIFNARETF